MSAQLLIRPEPHDAPPASSRGAAAREEHDTNGHELSRVDRDAASAGWRHSRRGRERPCMGLVQAGALWTAWTRYAAAVRARSNVSALCFVWPRDARVGTGRRPAGGATVRRGAAQSAFTSAPRQRSENRVAESYADRSSMN